jgi:hypothetical protein
MMLNHPAAAIHALTSFTADPDEFEYSYDWMPARLLAAAYHMNGDYEGQLRVAREGQRRFPGVLQLYSQEGAALAALGRLDEIEKVIEACEALGGSRSGSPAGVMSAVYSELRAHGHREASLKVAERTVHWYQARPAVEAADSRGGLLESLCYSERWNEAKTTADVLLAENPDDIGRLGSVGVLAARLGDAAQARRIEADLAAITRPYLRGLHTYQRACIAAQLGENDRALALLRDAFARGFEFNEEVHRDANLEPLWGYPPYEELMRPKG